ncbi:MAG: hypothetical protein ACREK5_01280 [Gemmatimonadota bacterium]
MKKKSRAKATEHELDKDTLRSEYDFSDAVRGKTAARYAEGTNIVLIDPEVLDVFPDADAVNETLRALAPVIRRQRKSKGNHGA